MIPASFSRQFRLFALCCLIGAMSLLGACDSAPDGSQTIATQWHQRDIAAHLSRWLSITPTPSGLLSGRFDRQWRPIPSNGTDLTTQSRLIYTMVVGYETTGERRYLDVAVRAADFLLSRFHDPAYGGFYDRVDADGNVVNPAKRTYGHAFALLALSHVARVTREERFRTAALTAWREIDESLRDSDGGLRPEAPRDFAQTNSLRNQNPVMHMFEALLALVDATGDPQALAGAQSVGNFVLYRLLQGEPDGGAYIPEWYDAHWQPLPSREKGGYIDIGHQFEWSHLLASAERRDLPPLYGMVAERLLKYGLRIGYDETDGGVFNRVYPDGSVDHDKFYWQQAEALRALMVAASNGNRSDLWRRYGQTLEFVKARFVDDTHGGWWPAARQGCNTGRCDDAQPDPYHMVGMDAVALSLSKSGR